MSRSSIAVNRGGKGSLRNYVHPNGIRVTILGHFGDDAKPYQEREVGRTIPNGEPIENREDVVE